MIFWPVGRRIIKNHPYEYYIRGYFGGNSPWEDSAVGPPTLALLTFASLTSLFGADSLSFPVRCNTGRRQASGDDSLHVPRAVGTVPHCLRLPGESRVPCLSCYRWFCSCCGLLRGLSVSVIWFPVAFACVTFVTTRV